MKPRSDRSIRYMPNGIVIDEARNRLFVAKLGKQLVFGSIAKSKDCDRPLASALS